MCLSQHQGSESKSALSVRTSMKKNFVPDLLRFPDDPLLEPILTPLSPSSPLHFYISPLLLFSPPPSSLIHPLHPHIYLPPNQSPIHTSPSPPQPLLPPTYTLFIPLFHFLVLVQYILFFSPFFLPFLSFFFFSSLFF